ncbi:MAG: S8 family serine peptidase [Ilumatobacteraceae bacterium]
MVATHTRGRSTRGVIATAVVSALATVAAAGLSVAPVGATGSTTADRTPNASTSSNTHTPIDLPPFDGDEQLSEYLIAVDPTVTGPDTIAGAISAAGGVVTGTYPDFSTISAQLTAAQVEALGSDPAVTHIEADQPIDIEAPDTSTLTDRVGTEPGPIPGRYIITLRRGVNPTTRAAIVSALGNDVVATFRHAIDGYVADLSDAEVKAVKDLPGIASIENDAVITLEQVDDTSGELDATGTQTSPPWGLDRLDQVSLPLDGSYTDRSSGTGVTAYIIDTGITAHPDFGDRLVAGRNFYTSDQTIDDTDDCNGHGTHVAGTVAGTVHGVAKGATLVPARVFGCSGGTSTSIIVAAMDWIVANHTAGTPAVANMSLGGGASFSLDQGVRSMVADGIVVAVAAGNSNQNACYSSPAREPLAITVAASTSTDARASFSNFGQCVDLFAPGVSIRSAWPSDVSPFTSTHSISGTSMASPHVAGAAAVIWGEDTDATASTVTADLLSAFSPDKISDPGDSTPNRLLFLSPGEGTPPSSPTDAAATLDTETGVVTVTWTASADSGSGNVASYTVTPVDPSTGIASTPTCTWTSGPLECGISGLRSGTWAFVVRAANPWGSSPISERSNTVTIAVTNDDWAGARPMTGTTGTLSGSNSSASTEPGEPASEVGTGTATKWFRYTPAQNGSLVVDTRGSSFDTVLGVYTGTAVSALTRITFNDDTAFDGRWTLQSRVTLTVAAGTDYWVRVNSYSSTRGTIVLNWNQTVTCAITDVANDLFCAARSLTGSTDSDTVDSSALGTETGEPGAGSRSVWYTYAPTTDGTLRISRPTAPGATWIEVYTGSTLATLVAHPGWTPLTGTEPTSGTLAVDDKTTYVIRHATDSSGALTTAVEFTPTPTLTVPGAPSQLSLDEDVDARALTVGWAAPVDDGGSPIVGYEVTAIPADDSCSTDGTGTSCVLDGLQPWKRYTISVHAVNAIGAGPTVSATGSVGNANDTFADALVIAGDDGTTYSSNVIASSEAGEPAHRFGPYHSMWFSYTPAADGRVTVTTRGSNYDTTLAAYTGTTVGSLTQLAANDDASGTLTSMITFDATAGVDHRIAVDGYGGGRGAITLNWSIERAAPPAAPTGVRAIATGADRALVAWTNPTSASPITGGTVTATPSGATCTTSSLPQCEITGLTTGATYTFTVVVANALGASPTSSPSDPLTLDARDAGRRTSFPNSWGIDRIDQENLPLDGIYSTAGRGDGVTVFVVDTGIAEHDDLGNRLLPGFTSIGDGVGATDCHGHGTHVASTSVGTRHGVADDALVVPVRVLDCGGGGSTAGVIAGLQWIADYDLGDRRGVVNMSLGGGASATLDRAVADLVDAGIVVAVAAGNEAQSACNVSPAREPSAITVAASDSSDNRAWFSNFGSCVDIFAPGVDIRAASIASRSATTTMSGTSMASPHVAGAAALVLGAYPTLTPAGVAELLTKDATMDVIVGPGTGSPNRLLMVAGDSLPLDQPPVAPKQVAATPGDRSAVVTWLPGDRSGSGTGSAPAIASFTATATLGTATGSVTVGSCTTPFIDQAAPHSCTIGDLTNEVEHTITVTARNVNGTEGDASAAVTVTPAAPAVETPDDLDGSDGGTPAEPGTPAPDPDDLLDDDLDDVADDRSGSDAIDAVIAPIEPERMLDTRQAVSASGVAPAKVGGANVLELPVLGRSGVPTEGVAAVAMNVTVTDTEVGPEGGYLTVFPCGGEVPNVSNINFVNGQTVANSVIAPVSAAGTVCFYVYGRAHVIADISGAIMDGNGFASVQPTRRADTRSGLGDVPATAVEYSVLEVPMVGRAGVPVDGVAAVSINLTVTGTVAPPEGGYATVFPCGGSIPNASNLNFTTGQTVPNSVISPLSADGRLCVFVYGSAHVIIDVNGVFAEGAGYASMDPARLADTRQGTRVGNRSGTGRDLVVQVTGRAGVPAAGGERAVSAALNVTVTNTEAPDSGGYVTVYPCGARPDSSNLNFTTGQTIANAVLAPLSETGAVCVHVFGSADVLVDVNGYVIQRD